MAREDFIRSAAGAAQVSAAETGVPASVKLAQAILESAWGESHMGDANNYFGIKASLRGGRMDFGRIAIGHVVRETREFRNGRWVTEQAFFRKYRNMVDSFRDHSFFLRDNPRYRAAFQVPGNADEFARRIHSAGYATDPNYSKSLIQLMKRHNLYQYDVRPIPKIEEVDMFMFWNEGAVHLADNWRRSEFGLLPQTVDAAIARGVPLLGQPGQRSQFMDLYAPQRAEPQPSAAPAPSAAPQAGVGEPRGGHSFSQDEVNALVERWGEDLVTTPAPPQSP